MKIAIEINLKKGESISNNGKLKEVQTLINHLKKLYGSEDTP